MNLSYLANSLTAGIDRPFLKGFKQSFGDSGFLPELISIVLTTLFVIAVVGILGLIINRIIKSRRAKLKPSNWITLPAEIHDILDNAMAQRSKIELQFEHSSTGVSVNCAFLDLTDENIILQAPGHMQISENWIERRVTCMFGLLVTKTSGMVRFHLFDSQIRGVKRLFNEDVELTLTIPDKLIVQQKRVHLRIEPPSQYIMGMAFWPEVLDEGSHLEKSLRKWGKPLAKFIKGGKNPVRVVNISAAGIRLELEPELVTESGSSFEIGTHYFLLIDLFDPTGNKKLRLWLNIKIQNRFEDFHTKKLGIGCQIEATAEIKDKEQALVQWRKMTEDGVEILGNWTVQRHLELFREKGVVD